MHEMSQFVAHSTDVLTVCQLESLPPEVRVKKEKGKMSPIRGFANSVYTAAEAAERGR